MNWLHVCPFAYFYKLSPCCYLNNPSALYLIYLFRYNIMYDFEDTVLRDDILPSSNAILQEHKICIWVKFFHLHKLQTASVVNFHLFKFRGSGNVCSMLSMMKYSVLGDIAYMISFYLRYNSMTLSHFTQLPWTAKDCICGILYSFVLSVTSFNIFFLVMILIFDMKLSQLENTFNL